MTKLVAGGALAGLSLFMLLGFLNSEVTRGAPSTWVALALTVGLPAIASVLLFRSHFGERDRLQGRKAQLRQQTIDAEILRLAGEHGGRLTAVEVARLLTMTPEAAKDALDGLAVRSQADYEITDAGLIVYNFHEVRQLRDKDSAKDILDA